MDVFDLLLEEVFRFAGWVFRGVANVFTLGYAGRRRRRREQAREAEKASARAEKEQQDRGRLAHLVGQTGVAASAFRPMGILRIEDQDYDATSDAGFIERGQPVQVVRTEGARVYVRVVGP